MLVVHAIELDFIYSTMTIDIKHTQYKSCSLAKNNQLVLSEVSRLYAKKCLRKTPEKIKIVLKKYNGENGLQ